jgi:hypothetical protein
MIMSVEAFRTDVIVFIGDIMMCFTSDWPINLCMRVINWPNIFVDQSRSVIQTLSAAHIKGKMSNLPINILLVFANLHRQFIIDLVYYFRSWLYCYSVSTYQKTLDHGQIKRFLTILISRHDSFLSTFINLFPWHLSSCFSTIVINRSSS